MTTPYDTGLDRNSANYVPLSPLSMLRRTARVYPERTAVIHGKVRRSWAETETRCRRLASALVRRGIGLGDTVAIMAPNIPEFVEAHFGVPMAGAVLNSLNIRLDAEALAFTLRHGEAKVVLTDREFSGVIAAALAQLEERPLVIDIDDPQGAGGELIGDTDYEAFLEEGDPDFAYGPPADEWQAIALNYTSGTTGDPKGVVYSHRGAYLNAISNAVDWAMPHFPVYLWTLPMFHCNGWCFPWTVTAKAGTHVCLRKPEASAIFQAIREHGVTHLCGAPIIMSMMVNAAESERRAIGQGISMMTAGAAPPAAVIEKMEAMGIEVIHVYGLTEVYGPCVVCAWKPKWDALPVAERAARKARQGVPYTMQEDLTVMDPDSLQPVPADGKTIGEIMIRGNIVMRGYLKNPRTTTASFGGGWFHSGDLGVMHPDGYIEIKDRSKDIIISGGENISSIEVEAALYKHPSVAAAAVVAKPDEKWGETPCAFVELRPGIAAEEGEIIAFCRERLAHFKCPRQVVFVELPKTSTGKIQKFRLREMAKALI
ncbi:acyl-CoA synthetase [Pelagibius marinus]|uniref:acyl-CoA synthetase n=1 Tax=Pelagibius marinus TaxID=2762760 RepID=UPI001872A91A|nr:acyl-CoA synthetase [Pelagibius marinus]